MTKSVRKVDYFSVFGFIFFAVLSQYYFFGKHDGVTLSRLIVLTKHDGVAVSAGLRMQKASSSASS